MPGSFGAGQDNPVVRENRLPGSPRATWDVEGIGSPEIQGFATDASYDRGETVELKIDTTAADYRVDIYRLGHYGGAGARLVATVDPCATMAKRQPPARVDTHTGLHDCGTWEVSARWQIPSTAVSGIYIARPTRTDGVDGASHILFVVRDDDRRSALLFQTSDTTWQAYNTYGGRSLYRPNAARRAHKVSYNRPLLTRAVAPASSLFNAEYPMVRWLEANGFDVSYTTGVDTARRGELLLRHDVFLSVGQDEYWSGEQRAHVEAARDAGVHLAFFSGNSVFWRTRWESSFAEPDASHRTLVSYKESHEDATDPGPEWTGTWRDRRQPSGGAPENSLKGTLFAVNGPRDDAIVVPYEDGQMRLWRNTDIADLAPGQSASLPAGTLGFEWDEDVDNGHRPPGLVRLSSTTVKVKLKLHDVGISYAPARATHHATIYRHASGALVFSAGTVQWSWGLDDIHDNGVGRAIPRPDVRMQQATVNLLADMGVQPQSLQPGLVRGETWVVASSPTARVLAPADGASARAGRPTTVRGTATHDGGVVGAVEVSVDGGATWHPAIGRSTWRYTWVPASEGPASIRARAADDLGTLGTASPPVTVDVRGGTAKPIRRRRSEWAGATWWRHR